MYLPICLLLMYTVTAAEHKRLVLHSDLDISTAFGNLQQNLTDFGNKIMQLESKIGQLESENIQLETKSKQQDSRVSQLESENQRLGTKISHLETSTLQNGNKGDVYVRWGRNTCPDNETELIYKEMTFDFSGTVPSTIYLSLFMESIIDIKQDFAQSYHSTLHIFPVSAIGNSIGIGIIGGTLYTSKGGASNSLCLPENPTWNKYVDGAQGSKSTIYGTEIEVSAHFSTAAFGHNYNNQDPPCALCYSSRKNTVMIPGRSNCYPGWTVEYTGYLVGGYPGHASSDYICLDSSPEKLPHGLDSTSDDQHVLYFVEAHCGSLPCPPYHEGREIACVVCSK